VLAAVQALCRSAADLAELAPWDALVAWLRQLAADLAAKRALAPELLGYLDPDAPFFTASRSAIHAAGGPLVTRAQRVGVLRADTDLHEIIRMLGAIARIPNDDGVVRVDHIFEIALDGLRCRDGETGRDGSGRDGGPAARDGSGRH
jgi:hypothetical protein